jgi:putative ABC transport system permease protein
VLSRSRFLKTLQLGLKSLLLHKLRSGLAILGIFIGVTAVIWLVAMGEGVSYQAQQQIKDLGATNIIVRNMKPPQEGSKGGGGRSFLRYGLLRDDFERIVGGIPTVKQAVPMREIAREARYLDRSGSVRLVGCTPEYAEINNLKMARGRFLTAEDEIKEENYAVIGDGAAQMLFPYQDPIGKAVQIDKEFYVIIGQTAERMATGNIGGSFSSQNYNLDIYIPLNTLRWRIGDSVISSRTGSREGEIVELSQITVTVYDLEQVDETASIIKTLLEKFHKQVDYAITVPKELLRQAQVLQMMFNVLLVLIAGIALLVGGIGIMNIMLATVTERTREIGIRRALGAKRRDIVQQFLSETVVLSGAGGLLGVLAGFACKPVVSSLRWTARFLLPDLMNSLPSNIQQLEPRIATWSVVASFLISVGVGVVFGLYPAQRAARMDPIEALRHE